MNFLQGEIAIQYLAYAIFYGNQYFKLQVEICKSGNTTHDNTINNKLYRLAIRLQVCNTLKEIQLISTS